LKFVKNLFVYIFNFIKARTGDVLSGFVFWLPIGITILVGSYIYDNLEGLGEGFLAFFLPEKFVYPGFGILLWIIVFLLTGAILRNTAIGDYLSRIPILGIFFRRRGVRL